jgi:hypothetical protein
VLCHITYVHLDMSHPHVCTAPGHGIHPCAVQLWGNCVKKDVATVTAKAMILFVPQILQACTAIKRPLVSMCSSGIAVRPSWQPWPCLCSCCFCWSMYQQPWMLHPACTQTQLSYPIAKLPKLGMCSDADPHGLADIGG